MKGLETQVGTAIETLTRGELGAIIVLLIAVIVLIVLFILKYIAREVRSMAESTSSALIQVGSDLKSAIIEMDKRHAQERVEYRQEHRAERGIWRAEHMQERQELKNEFIEAQYRIYRSKDGIEKELRGMSESLKKINHILLGIKYANNDALSNERGEKKGEQI